MGDKRNITSNNRATNETNGYADVDVNSYQYLQSNSLEKCEFCDRTSKNKYNSFIHNARHIIIPLLRQRVLQCRTCLHHFTSRADLNRHVLVKHDITTSPHVLVKPVDLNNVTVYEISDSDSDSDVNLDTIKKAQDTKLKNTHSKINLQNGNTNNVNIKNNFCSNEHNLNHNINIVFHHPTIKIHNGVENLDSNIENSKSQIETYSSGIKNRLLFEEDIPETDRLLTDFTTECKVNVEMFPAPHLEECNKMYNARSVGYDELNAPGIYKCRRCSKRYISRYKLIMHETRHLSLKKCRIQMCRMCNTYVEGGAADLCRHRTLHHGPKLEKCLKCGLCYDDYAKHNKFYCTVLNINHKFDYQESTKILNLCDMCFTFCKNNRNKTYEMLGYLSKLGKRYPCQRCGVLFFELKVVNRRRRVATQQKKEKDERKRKVHSNQERLKNIQQRLKHLKF